MSWIFEYCRRLAASWSATMAAARSFPISEGDEAERDALERERDAIVREHAALTPWWF